MAIEIEIEYDKIYRYCYFHVKNQHLAEDFTQETFLRYYRHKADYTKGSALAYLYTIARNICIDFYRERKTEELTEESICAEPMDELVEQLDMRSAIAALPKEQQEIFMLRYAQELPVGETGKILNISRFAVYRKEKEALRMLKEIMEGGKMYE